jgi:thioredoxin-like negative regulator of GroEL
MEPQTAPAREGHSMQDTAEQPKLLLFHSHRSGQCRRVESWLAQTLQRRGNHKTFDVRSIAVEEHPEIHERFLVEDVPTLVVVEERKVVTRLARPRRGSEIDALLAPWLR